MFETAQTDILKYDNVCTNICKIKSNGIYRIFCKLSVNPGHVTHGNLVSIEIFVQYMSMFLSECVKKSTRTQVLVLQFLNENLFALSFYIYF